MGFRAGVIRSVFWGKIIFMKKLFSRIVAALRRPEGWHSSDIGMAWYREDQWHRLLELSVDGDRLEKTYAQWRQAAQARFDELIKKGMPIVKVPVDVEDLSAWCRELGRVVDGEGRVAYVKNRVAQVKMGNIEKL